MFVDDTAADHGQDRYGRQNLARRGLEYVGGQHHEIGEFTRFDRPFARFREFGVGGAQRVERDRLFERNALLREPAAWGRAIGELPRDRGIETEHWIERLDVPIGSERDMSAGIDKRLEV